MGPRRRPAHFAAVALPASRLPLGTPTLTQQNSSSSPDNASRSPPPSLTQRNSNSSLGKSSLVESGCSAGSIDSLNMSSKDSSGQPLAKSIAESKLERQRKRIEEAEAALHSHLSHERHQPISAKKTKPPNSRLDNSHISPNKDGSLPVTEVRVNTFRAISHERLLQRPASVLSQRTSETSYEKDRQDDALTDDDFQIFLGRKNKKAASKLNAYEDRPEERQTTVEAAFDKREVYDVFNNALPGPAFVQENPGSENGQVQFIQHPNGDISAHQWSQTRYIWENIGQFSNIRKKIEGQLAADRLKGQTAHQTLQQNTLAYFRTIAKQREAAVMGRPFGPNEIEAAMPPRLRHEVDAAPTALTERSKGLPQPGVPHITPEPLYKDIPAPNFVQTDPAKASSRYSSSLLTASQGPHTAQYGRRIPYGAQPEASEDPFYSRSTYQQIYGGLPYTPQYYHQQPLKATAPASGPFFGMVQRPQGLNYNFHFPAAEDGHRPPQPYAMQPSIPYHPASMAGAGSFPQVSATSMSYGRANSSADQLQHPVPNRQYSYGQLPSITRMPSHDNTNYTPSSVAPGNRASMSDQLWKISETAKERNLSQTSLGRTVLYDPYQNKAAEPGAERKIETHTAPSTAFIKNVLENALQPPTSMNTASPDYFPTTLAPSVTMPLSPPIHPAVENPLHASSPDTLWSKKPYAHITPHVTTPSHCQGVPQSAKGRHFAAEDSAYASETTSTTVSLNTYDGELQHWWTSGNKFARQQDFFESIQKANNVSTTTVTSPPHLTPIGPPSRTPKKQQAPAPYNEMTTRLLIPVLENLASYVQGPVEKRRDYFCQWSKAPDWAIDTSEEGNNSFYDKDWGQPPARVGRDPRYSNRSWSGEQEPVLSNRFMPAAGPSGAYGHLAVGGGLDRRFGVGGRF